MKEKCDHIYIHLSYLFNKYLVIVCVTLCYHKKECDVDCISEPVESTLRTVTKVRLTSSVLF